MKVIAFEEHYKIPAIAQANKAHPIEQIYEIRDQGAGSQIFAGAGRSVQAFRYLAHGGGVEFDGDAKIRFARASFSHSPECRRLNVEDRTRKWIELNRQRDEASNAKPSTCNRKHRLKASEAFR
jgi:hypothetical protein